MEVRQTDHHGRIIAWDQYALTRELPECVEMVRLCEDSVSRVSFNPAEINLLCQIGEQGRERTITNIAAILSLETESNDQRIADSMLQKLNVLSDESCMELIAVAKRQKIMENAYFIIRMRRMDT